jgi:3-oxoacyl-[acyl-carrier protein] reductase
LSTPAFELPNVSTFVYTSDEIKEREDAMNELLGKVAIVTGASKGIGAGIARAYGAAGAAVVVNYASDAAGAERVVRDVEQSGGKAVALRADMKKPDDVVQLFATTREQFGRLDVLVNNAGVYHFDPIEQVTEAEFWRQFDTNVLGPIIATREAARAFGDEGGSVINVGSGASRNPPPTSAVYSATKAALDSVTRSLSQELGARKIRVNSLNPGITETEGVASAGILGSDFQRGMVAQTPLGRMGQPDDIAAAALFLASDASRWVTGETLFVTGGLR